ncbi:serine hydrolase domain-containing protein [Jannaschia aquimarina]|uniref:NylB'_2 protein n=1 Tax=Jannaschia aquimarina TaxID=935700 RepID=A0A0D1CIC9_9RHOB|nr:serine hydrolase [Jannaschia aquimarina]KIT14457.1 6-aminohexanoate-dimer hydrolase [Jannaschia aquimarina]SNT29111.1 hypothetical protein SAMN05421775_11054 [Jannaschia aquimarina]
MKKWLRIMGVSALGLSLLTAGGALWKREELARLWAVNSLFEPDRIVANFSNMDRAFLNVPLTMSGDPLPLAPTDPVPLPRGTDAWLTERAVTALVVLRGGEITHESYHLGTSAADRRISWSVAKSFLSLLTGILLDEQVLALTDPITRHVPALAATAYDGATVEDVLQMESGVEFDEDYLARNSDINRMGRELALGGTLDGFAAGLSARARAPGEAMQYVSMDTHVLGMVLRGATGREIPELLSERLLGPMGAEGPGYYLTDGSGVAFVLGGLNLTTLDYARFGLLVARDGRRGERQIVPADWVRRATTASARTAPGETRYGYQFWIPAEPRSGEVLARGIYGQYVYVDRARDIVVAVNAADRSFREPGAFEASVEMMRAIADAQMR